MRKRLLVVLTVLAVAVPALAHAISWIDLYPVIEGNYQSTCNFNEPAAAGLREVAVVLNSTGELFVGVRFAVASTGITWQQIAITTPYASVGFFNDFSVGFGICLTPPAMIATLQYFAPSHSPCGKIAVVAPSLFVSPLGNNCVFDEIPLQSHHMTVNGVYGVPEGGDFPECYCPPLATRPSTWGRVKALYHD